MGSEFQLQRFVVQLLTLSHAKGIVWFAVPNGEHRSKRTGARLKAMGVRRGVADLEVILPGGRAAFLELKSPTGRPSAEQKEFRAAVESAGCLYAIVSTPEDAERTLAGWGALRRAPTRSERIVMTAALAREVV